MVVRLVQELGKTPKTGMENGVTARNVKVRLATDAPAERPGLVDNPISRLPNYGEAAAPGEIADRSTLIDADAESVVSALTAQGK